jgi:hypothetical protein
MSECNDFLLLRKSETPQKKRNPTEKAKLHRKSRRTRGRLKINGGCGIAQN